jgi:single-stranded DNA-binding protein
MKRYITEINAAKVTFLGGRGDGGSQNSGGYQGGGSGGAPSDSGGAGDSFSGGPGPNDDDIPF